MNKSRNQLYSINRFYAVLVGIIICLITFSRRVNAEETTIVLEGELMNFNMNSFEYETKKNATILPNSTKQGEAGLKGDIEKDDDKTNGMPSYTVFNDNVTFTYKMLKEYMTESNNGWSLFPYNFENNVGSTRFSTDIDSGAVIVQSSLDGKRWNDIVAARDAFKENKNYYGMLYTPTSMELENGCYYRIVVAYELQRPTGKKGFFSDTEYTRRCEVYKFYLHSSESIDTQNLTKQTLGSLVNAGTGKGYNKENIITSKDPHYGWELGKFYVKGYTRLVTQDDGSKVFLKNVGDEVVLSYTLLQNIYKLNGDDKLSIDIDKKGEDQYFQISPMNMGKGTLIVRYTDETGNKHQPEIYKNFLEANARPNADTVISLYEEGDYEVALDYMIKKVPARIIGIEAFPNYTYYRESFKFSVRNGNCMVYPFDIETGSELADMSITENGFKLDMARSRYLNIDVTRTEISESKKVFKEDVRFNKPAKDGDIYEDEGIYTFDVKNLYTGESTKKTIFVGSNPIYNVLSVNRITINELNDYIREGYSIDDEGNIYKPDDDHGGINQEPQEEINDEDEISEEEYRELILNKVEKAIEENAEYYSIDIEKPVQGQSKEEYIEYKDVRFSGTVDNAYIEEVVESADGELIYEVSVYLVDQDDDLWITFVELHDGSFSDFYDACVGKEIVIDGMMLSVDETVPIVYGYHIEEKDSDVDIDKYMTPWVELAETSEKDDDNSSEQIIKKGIQKVKDYIGDPDNIKKFMEITEKLLGR